MSRKLSTILGVVALVMIGAFYVGVWRHESSQLTTARAALTAAQANGYSISLQEASLQKERLQLPAEAREAEALEQAVPTTPDIAGVIDQVAAVASSSGVVVTSESQSAPATPATVSSAVAAPASGAVPISMSLTVSGTRAQLLTFVHDLESVHRLVDVSSLTLANSTSPATTGTAPSAGTSAVPAASTTVSATIWTSSTGLPPVPKLPH